MLVDDEERLLDSISKRISLLGLTPLKALSGLQALEIARGIHIDLAIVDLKMPDMDGLVTITKLKEILPDLRTVLLTGYGNEKVRQATEALGSVYVEKDSMGGLWDMIKHWEDEGKTIVIKPSASRHNAPAAGSSGRVEISAAHEYPGDGLSSAGRDPGNRPGAAGPLLEIVGETEQVLRLKKNIRRIAEMDCAVIIKGELGTGKELAARTIHALSRRRHQKFLAFDCGCFSKDFRFAELVAAYDDTPKPVSFDPKAGPEKPPVFSGTILLDHIENMPDDIQREMLGIIDKKRDTSDFSMDIRFIVAAQQNIQERVKEGKFPMDLFSRMRAMEIEIPPLRQRTDDLALLCRFFLDRLNQEFGRMITLPDEVLSAFQSYDFPGNVRELKHIIENAFLRARGEDMAVEHLPDRLRVKTPKALQEEEAAFLTIQQMEYNHILKAIEMTRGNKTKAAELLGISRAALWRKLRLISDQGILPED